MLKCKKIAVTGTVASGKSSVLSYFKEFGAYVVDSDRLVHELLSEETDLKKQIIKLLGPEVVESGHLSQKKIAEKVFRHPENREALEKLIHPFVLEKIETLHKEIEKDQKYHLFVAEVPLLFEIAADDSFDVVITVQTDDKICKERFSKPFFEERMQRQFSAEKKAKLADFVIENNGTKEELKTKTHRLYDVLMSR